MPTLRVATAHTSPVFLSSSETATQICSSIRHAASQKAQLITFPEAYLPGFPYWLAVRPTWSNHALFQAYSTASVCIDGPEVQSIRATARETGVAVSLGISERDPRVGGRLWNSNVFINGEGEILVHHRKLMPTWFEKLVWSPGDGAGLKVASIPMFNDGPDNEDIGAQGKTEARISTLICGENTNPLARYAVASQGIHLHISTWPAIWPTRLPPQTAQDTTSPSSVTNNGQPPAQGRNYNNLLANRLRAAAQCFEAKCFGVLSASALSPATIDAIAQHSPSPNLSPSMVASALEHSPRAASMFLDPTGEIAKGWIVNEKGEKEDREYLQTEEGLLFADLDLEMTIEGRQYHDLGGSGYQRGDVFELQVNRQRKGIVEFVD
ncbi:hypothetical protein MBLNU457_7522t1 [Dothideomycetes sp. NU457]